MWEINMDEKLPKLTWEFRFCVYYSIFVQQFHGEKKWICHFWPKCTYIFHFIQQKWWIFIIYVEYTYLIPMYLYKWYITRICEFVKYLRALDNVRIFKLKFWNCAFYIDLGNYQHSSGIRVFGLRKFSSKISYFWNSKTHEVVL